MAQEEASKTSNENMLFKIAGMVAQSFLKGTPELTRSFIESLENYTPRPDKEKWENWTKNLVTSGFVDEDTAKLLASASDYNFPYNILAYALIPLQVLLRDMANNLDIYGLDRQYDAQAKTTPHPAPVDNLVRSMMIDPSRANENRAQLKRLGYSELQIDNIILSYYRLVPEEVLRINYLRGNIDEERLYERMRELGYTDLRTQEVVQTWELLPGPQDLFTMVAKEAFEPDIYNVLGLAAEFPEDQVEWLEKQGINRGWAEKYWIAHWDQPSIGQGFEMLHRGVIDYKTLDLLFRAVEIPSFWRDKLTKIAYNPLTRVDVRRMHEAGVIDDERLTKAYLDLGFSPADALAMANWTIIYNQSGNKDLTKAAILESLELGVLTRGQALELLTAQDYDEATADYYITLSEFNRAKKLQEEFLMNIKERYLLDVITETELRSELNASGLTGEAVEVTIDSLRIDKYKYAALPSRTNLDNFLARGIITEDQYRQVMTRLGYQANHIEWYLKDLEHEIGTPHAQPSRSDVTRWRKNGIISDTLWSTYMRNLGYSEDDITNYFREL